MSIYKPISFLFPGQASQYAGLGKELFDHPIAKRTFQQASEILGFDMVKLCFEGTDEQLSQTANTQPAILTVSISAWLIFCEMHMDELQKGNFNIVGMAGHSLGEYSALVAAGAMSFEDALRTVRLRGQAMQSASDEAGETMMSAIIGLTFEQIESICEEVIDGEILNPANFNSPKQVVISGHKNSVIKAGEKAKEFGGKFIPIKVSAPFHCDIMRPVELVLEKHFSDIDFRSPSIPVIRNIDAMIYRSANEVPNSLVAQATSSVLWDLSINNLIRKGAEEFFVFCPSKVIVGLMRQIDKTIPVYGLDDLESLQNVINKRR